MLDCNAGGGRFQLGGVICHPDGAPKSPLTMIACVPDESRRRFLLPAALQHNNAARNVMADALTALFDAGSANSEGSIRLYTSGFIDLLATIPMANPSFGTASVGVCQGNGLPWSDPFAAASGIAAAFQIIDRDETVVLTGEVAVSEADITFPDCEIAVNDVVKILSASYTAPP